jgi:PAS domain S-box-containing protein
VARLPGIGKRIGRRLVELGFSKSGRPDVARFCVENGYRPQYVYAWLAGRTPTYENLERLATDLGVSRSWLAVGDESTNVIAQEATASEAPRGRPAGRPQAPRRRRAPGPERAYAPAPVLQVLDFARLRDVTAKLVQLEAQLAAIFEAFPDLYIWVDGTGRILAWKGGRTAAPDVLHGPCIGRRIDEVFPGDTGRRLLEATVTTMRLGTPAAVDYAETVQGVERTFEGRLMPLDAARTANGQVLIVVRDITDRVRAEHALRESVAHYRALVEGSIQGIWISQDSVIRFANQPLCDIYGFPGPESLLGQPITLMRAQAEHERLDGYRRARLRGEPAPTRYEHQALRADGTPIWLENVVSPVTWDGAPAFLITVQDITERKRAQEAAAALGEIGRRMATVLDPQELVPEILESVMRLLHLRRAALYMLDASGRTLKCLASRGETGAEALVGREIAVGQGILGTAVARRRPVVTPDILAEPDLNLPDWLVELSRTHSVTAVMSAPLIARGRVVGGLVVGDTRGRVYTDDELALLATFADQAAVAFDNARRHADLEARLRVLESPQG